jgi:adenosine deaminase
MNWYERIPKAELHVHLEGAIPHQGLFELIQKYGGDRSVPDATALSDRFQYTNFSQFIEKWIWKNQFLREYEDFTFIAECVARDFAKQHIIYAEMFFSPSSFSRRGLAIQELTQAIRTGLSRVPEVQIVLIADLVRDFGPESEMTTLKQLGEVKHLGVLGIGIGGSEHKFPPRPFEPVYREARQMGFHTNAHAGEAMGAQSIWDAIRYLHVDRIGHGTRAFEDNELVKYLVDHRIPLEMCPVSNVRTRAVDHLLEHPIRRYFEAGMMVTVNTDDPKMFQTSLAEEYRLLEQECGWTKMEICGLILNAIESSWQPAEQKAALVARFKQDELWQEHAALGVSWSL